MLAAAAKDKSIQLSVIGDNNLVLPLKLDSATLQLDRRQAARHLQNHHQRQDAYSGNRGQQHSAGGQAA